MYTRKIVYEFMKRCLQSSMQFVWVLSSIQFLVTGRRSFAYLKVVVSDNLGKNIMFKKDVHHDPKFHRCLAALWALLYFPFCVW